MKTLSIPFQTISYSRLHLHTTAAVSTANGEEDSVRQTVEDITTRTTVYGRAHGNGGRREYFPSRPLVYDFHTRQTLIVHEGVGYTYIFIYVYRGAVGDLRSSGSTKMTAFTWFIPRALVFPTVPRRIDIASPYGRNLLSFYTHHTGPRAVCTYTEYAPKRRFFTIAYRFRTHAIPGDEGDRITFGDRWSRAIFEKLVS